MYCLSIPFFTKTYFFFPYHTSVYPQYLYHHPAFLALLSVERVQAASLLRCCMALSLAAASEVCLLELLSGVRYKTVSQG